MNITQRFNDQKRQTTADEVFIGLYSDIISIRLKPGTKLSEAEISKQLGVSRQPVREAFMRLGELGLLLIRPQKATLVPKISLEALKTTRFIRAAIEVEVVRKACQVATKESLDALEENLRKQKAAMGDKDTFSLRDLDYEFHRLICVSADCLSAFKIISENKAHTERVCSLELADEASMIEVFEGHSNIVKAIIERDEEAAVKQTRLHLAHLDKTLQSAGKNHPDYFED
ncbi:MAG: GntR family transcriptional regulator [Nitratireductor sp.]